MGMNKRHGGHGDFTRRPRRINVTRRTRRTPYYMTGLPDKTVRYLIHLRTLFLDTFSRDYESSDPQFWDDTRRDAPHEQPGLDTFLAKTAEAMRRSNHHPAHIHAFTHTRRIIYGCGTCIDECSRCNFRTVPDDWTMEWTKATQEYERWAPGRSLALPEYGPGGVRWA